jgi:7-cyano-7-deazaguanine synthase
MKQHKNYVLILASGGIDSTACIRFYKKLKFEVEAIFVDYGQASHKEEYRSIKLIAKFYKIDLKRIIVKNIQSFKGTVIPGRNAFLYFTALMNFPKPHGIIASGIHSGTNYYDCSDEFTKAIEHICEKYSQGTIKIGVPFLNFNKKEIFDYCNIEKVPLNLTYSCELGKKQPCTKCDSCKDIQLLYVGKKL